MRQLKLKIVTILILRLDKEGKLDFHKSFRRWKDE